MTGSPTNPRSRYLLSRLFATALVGLFIAQIGIVAWAVAPRTGARLYAAKLSVGATAPPFSLLDTDGARRSLADYAGHPVSLFFYCGCPWCHRCARLWSRMQRAGALDKSKAVTLIVFQGDAAMAREFIAETGLDPARTVVTTDPSLNVTLGKYDAEVCPRVFVVSPSGKIAYTNNHSDDAPRKAPESLIVGSAVAALHKISSN